MDRKLVFITGASSGIGQALAWRFHQAGWSLALAARRTGEIQAWAQRQGIAADRYAVYEADVAMPCRRAQASISPVRRAASASDQPAWWKRQASAWPMPLEAPVMKASGRGWAAMKGTRQRGAGAVADGTNWPRTRPCRLATPLRLS